jgi:predicted enzyme related to lactoylglutathione lyase
MNDAAGPETGTIGWTDLTVDDADSLRDFYARVVGWSPKAVAMGTYSDYNMVAPQSDQPAAGICHRRGTNADLPAQRLIYITVADLNTSMARCRELGGRVIAGRRDMDGLGRYCVIEDPAGAVAALFESR